MALKFCANLSFMFNENGNLLERYASASNLGFKAVECAFPYEFSIADVVSAKTSANVQQVLINAYPGELDKGDMGLAAIPNREDDYNTSLQKTVEYALALDCKKVHVMAGKTMPSRIIDTAMGDVYRDNLVSAASLFEKNGIVGLIEPISHFAVPNYYMNSFQKALQLVKDIGSDSLKLQLDVYHLQLIEGNLTHRIKELLPYTGHIQISQAPDRHEPDSDGEINYQYVLGMLEKYGYDGYIGLEYRPSSDSAQSLGWMKKWGYTL